MAQGRVVQRLDNAIQRINRYPADKYWQNKLRYPLDSVIQPLNNRGQICNCFGFQIQYAFVSYHRNGAFVITGKRILQYLDATFGSGLLWFAYLDMSQFLTRKKVSDKWIDLTVAVFAETAHTLNFFPLCSFH